MKVQKKSAAVLFILLTIVISCGFTFKKKVVTLDTENHILYKNCSVGQISSNMEKDEDLAKKVYDDGYYAIEGVIKEISTNHKTVVIEDNKDHDNMTIECSAGDKSVIAQIENLKVGETVLVYGKIRVSAIQSKVSVDAAQIASGSGGTESETKYSYINGNSYDIASMDNRTLADGKVKYYISEKWAGVEKNNLEYNTQSMEGFQYILNEIPTESATEPESFFICYFDSNAKLNDRGQANDKKGIRKAIVDNILGADIENKEIIKIKTYYDSEYYYYVGSYNDKQEQPHRVEFVFQEVGNDGMVVYLYVYKEEKHLEDILSVMRFLEIQQ